ncbi:MAG: transposase, partial [Solirubrobacteraceae bacterium]|nr:transposase [Solirubrobacteraceae bacterium]
RKWKTYGAAPALCRALQAQFRIKVSARTVNRDLTFMGLHARVRRPIPTRDREELQAKRAFAREHRNTNHRTIAFSDESWITCNECTGRYEYVKKGQKPFPLERRARWNTPSAMVWACVAHNYKSPLIVFPSRMEDNDGELRTFRLDAANYVRRCLSVVVPTLLQRKLTLMQDGARSHVAKRTKSYLAKKKLPYLKNWPPYSPDLNMIEPLWKELNCRIGELCPQTQAELLKAAKKAWEALPQSVINSHVANWKTALARV